MPRDVEGVKATQTRRSGSTSGKSDRLGGALGGDSARKQAAGKQAARPQANRTAPHHTSPPNTPPPNTPTTPAEPSRLGGALVLLVLGLIWLAAYLWSAHASINGAVRDPIVAVIDAALALPGVIAATMLAGAAASVALLTGLSARRRLGRRGILGSAVGAGLVIGLLASGLIIIGYGHRSSIMILAWTVLAAGTIGGLLGSLRPRVMVSAGLSATIVAFFLGFALNFKQERLLKLFGAGHSTKSQVDALAMLTLTQSIVAGIIAGIIAFVYLRRTRLALKFPAYLVAGAMPGVLLLLAELVTWIGGRQLLGVAGKLSTFDQMALDYSGTARLNHGLVMLFVGGIVAMVAFGRTLSGKTIAIATTGTTGTAAAVATATTATTSKDPAPKSATHKDITLKDTAASSKDGEPKDDTE